MRKSLTTKNNHSKERGRGKRREKSCNISQHNFIKWGMKTCSYFAETYEYIHIYVCTKKYVNEYFNCES